MQELLCDGLIQVADQYPCPLIYSISVYMEMEREYLAPEEAKKHFCKLYLVSNGMIVLVIIANY